MKNKIFNYCLSGYDISIKDIKDLDALKRVMLEKKIVHSKYKYKIQSMSEEELKNFVYTSIYEEKKFEGIGILFMAAVEGDFKKIIKHILGLSYEAINILRMMIATLNNIDKYEGRFKLTLLEFNQKYRKKFKKNLFELGMRYNIDKLDLIDLLRRTIF